MYSHYMGRTKKCNEAPSEKQIDRFSIEPKTEQCEFERLYLHTKIATRRSRPSTENATLTQPAQARATRSNPRNGYKRGTPDLYPLPKTSDNKSSLQFTIRPRFVGLAARPRAATRSCQGMTSWRPALLALRLRCSAGGTGSAGCAGRSSCPLGGVVHVSRRSSQCSALSNTSDTRLRALTSDKAGAGRA